MRIMLTGGFTLGPVTPLLAVSEELRRRDPLIELFWIGTENGPERGLIQEYHIPFISIATAKFRRYFSIYHLIDNFRFLIGLCQAAYHLARIRPQVIVSAGGFISVPVVIAGWLMGVPAFIHQQDARSGFANKIMSPFAKAITVSFKKSLDDFRGKKVHWTGNPVREDIFHTFRREAFEYFDLDPNRPVLLALGGGTGARSINQILAQSLPEILKICQVIHIAGPGKAGGLNPEPGYRVYQLLTEGMPYAYDIADLVVSRAGMGTLTELSALSKPTILIPIPDSHQENNADMFKGAGALQIVNQKTLTPESFVGVVRDSFANIEQLKEKAKKMSEVLPRGARIKMAEMILKIAKD
ncbi:UDP-N-acetylglucosamine--N-acetylmuramyl-(pentapeptide) pyrophosphoryl-undecaprenol N-acetylglucosamine transferase [Patescibacteria group bacterium]|nr:UDP-N-acetylglucosamine--N-acetylmuramyl-(pentapeptide) pyrophosphoryl-undecaprenol N-acetylglucosamine transferase [Patescibacteria group bacterium]MBU1921837.1 UDP-N-acetylglucosamine--N-acetylmuramyl-(pentapeptide) pyrophosphoryl-undecaprenol N-acetylglucosamine transferase [Patescibacteria group bacterium]